MKNAYKYSLIAISVAVMALSCQKNPELTAPEENSNSVTLTCAFPTIIDENGTKVSLGVDGKTAWEADVDAIVFQGCPKDKEEHSIAPIVHTFTAAELSNPEVASFSVDLSSLRPDSDDGALGHDYNVAYPASIWSPYSSSHMYGRSSFSNTNKMLMAGYVDGSSIVLKHMTAAIVFKVAGDPGDYDTYTFEGNDDEVVGYTKLVVEVNKPDVTSYRKKYKTSSSGTSGPMTKISGTVVSDGSTVNTIFLPVNTKRSGDGPYTYAPDDENDANVAYLPDGFTIKLLKGGEIKKYITSTAPLTIRPGHMINLGELPAAKIYDYEAIPAPEKVSATELSNPKSANCYVVDGSVASNKKKVFKFPAVKGNTYVYGGALGTSVGTVASVGIVWETWNNAESVTANSVIKVVDYKDGFVYFKMPSTLHAGNALIAAYDGPYDGDGKPTGNILWSWHIWVPTDDVVSNDVTDATIFGSKPIMDRNLGALVAAPAGAVASVESYGLFYQWGRKDPFPGMGAVASDGVAKVAGTTMTKINGTMTIAETIQNPTKYAWNSSDWCDAGDQSTTLWTTTKTIYDPCPPGYIVPTRNTSLHYWGSTALNSLDATDKFVNNGGTYYSYQLGTDTAVVFPYAGYIDNDTGSYYKAGTRSAVWSSYCSTLGKAYARDSRHDSGTFNRGELKTSRGASVRCVAE